MRFSNVESENEWKTGRNKAMSEKNQGMNNGRRGNQTPKGEENVSHSSI